jgi:[acyl-carrier-protein] S-malonyltransferase
MPRHITIAFPGQGSQHLGMLDHFPPKLIKQTSDELSEYIDFNLIDLINDGPEERLNKTSFTQPALLLTSFLEYKIKQGRKSTRQNSSHSQVSRMPSSA